MRVTRACLTDSVVVCLLLLSAVLTPAITSAALISPNSRQRSDLSSQALSHPPPPALDLPSQSTNTDRHSPSSDHRSVIGDSRSLTTGEAIGVSRSEEKFPGENWRQQTLSANGADISDVNGNTRKSNEGNPLPMQGNFRRRNSWRQREPPNGEYGRPDTQPSQKGSSMASNDTSFSRNNNENFKQNRKNAVACASCKEQPYFSEDSPQLSEPSASETEAVSNTYGNSSASDRMMGDDPRIRATKGGASTRSATKSKGLSASGDSQGSLLPKVQSPYSEDIQLGCKELRARRFISDGFCTSEEPIREAVCTGNCLPIKNKAWFGEFIKTMARSKLREWQCVDDLTRMKRVKLLCHNGTYKTYRIKVVKSCKCARVGPRANRTSPGRRRRKGRRRKKDSNKTNSNKKRKKRRRRRKKKKHDRVRSRGGVVEGRQSRGRNSTLSTADDGDERPLGLS